MLRFFLLTFFLGTFFSCDSLFTYDLIVNGEAQHGYFITVSLGTPPQEINLLLDTGSSNIAVAAVPPIVTSLKYFKSNESTSLHQLDIAVDLNYVVGRWNGFLAKEIIKFDNVTVECTIACMLSIDQIFDEGSQFQGLLGLAYPSIAIPDSSVQPFFNTLIKTQNISDIFCLDLCGPYFTSKAQVTNCGKFQIGYVSHLYNIDEIVYTPIITEWYYEIMLTDLRVGRNHVPVICSELNKDRSVIDSGTTDLYLPETVYHWTLTEIKQIVQHIVPNKFWVNETSACVPNNHLRIEAFPLVTLSFYHTKNSTFNLVISPELYILPIQNQSKISACFKLAFAVSNNGVFIGSSILKGFYVVFDRQNKRIGFANSSQFNGQSDFPGLVMKPKYTTNPNIQWCKRSNVSNSSDISPLMIVVLCSSVMIAIILLYMLVSWIFKHFFMHSSESSEASSLVGEDEF